MAILTASSQGALFIAKWRTDMSSNLRRMAENFHLSSESYLSSINFTSYPRSTVRTAKLLCRIAKWIAFLPSESETSQT